MKLSKPIIFAIAIISLVVFWLFQSGHFDQTPIIFESPYPPVNENGDTILGVFEGRTPCTDCEKLKVALVLYKNRETKMPTTYWLGIVGVGKGNDRTVTEGSWMIERGINEYPGAVVYKLDSNTSPDLQFYWQVNENILLPLDQNMNPKVGNAGWGYMLSKTH